MDALSDRPAPELEPGVTLDSLATVEACDTALDRLTLSVASIEEQLARTPKNSVNQPPGWRHGAEKALRIKKLLLPRLQQRRSALARQARQDEIATRTLAARTDTEKKRRILIGLAWDIEPESMRRVEAIARERHPDLFSDGEAA
ncbi:MAG: hypothetical protein ACRYGP_16790 [Janthinobacterium lividum]